MLSHSQVLSPRCFSHKIGKKCSFGEIFLDSVLQNDAYCPSAEPEGISTV